MNKYEEIMKNTDAVLFDMDGTLIDSMWVWATVDEEFYERYGLTEPDDFYEQMEGKSFTEVAKLYLDAFPEIPFTLEELQQEWTRMAYEKYTTEVPLKEGVREFITSLKERNVKLGIGTSNGRELVDATLQALDIEQYFDSVHTSCEVETGKPSPDIYLLVAEDLGVDPSRCLVFEDVPNGILAGRTQACAPVQFMINIPVIRKIRKKKWPIIILIVTWNLGVQSSYGTGIFTDL